MTAGNSCPNASKSVWKTRKCWMDFMQRNFIFSNMFHSSSKRSPTICTLCTKHVITKCAAIVIELMYEERWLVHHTLSIALRSQSPNEASLLVYKPSRLGQSPSLHVHEWKSVCLHCGTFSPFPGLGADHHSS